MLVFYYVYMYQYVYSSRFLVAATLLKREQYLSSGRIIYVVTVCSPFI